MSTLRDLRETLEQHADGLDDHQRYVRPVAVRERIRVARRRRAAAAAVTAAVVLAAGVAAVASVQAPRELDPAGPDVIGVDVPDRVTLRGFPYELTGGDPLAGEGDRLRLQETDHAQAVSLVASGLGSGSATLYADGEAVARVAGAEQVAAPVPVGGTELLRVRLHGTADGAQAGVAIYGGTGELAPGVGNGVAVFREEVSGARLLAADFSTGAPEVGVRFQGPVTRARFSQYCRTDQDDLWVHVSVDGDPAVTGHCNSGDQTDPGTSWSALGVPGAGTHTVRVRVTRGEDGPVVTDPEVVVGIGVYDGPEPVRRLLGADVFPVVEYGGRTWTLDRVVDGHRTTVDTSEGDRLLAFVGAGELVYASWRGALDEGRSGHLSTAGVRNAGTITSGVLLAGDRYDVRLRSDSPPARGALLLYRPV